jgi:hypothetical protein
LTPIPIRKPKPKPKPHPCLHGLELKLILKGIRKMSASLDALNAKVDEMNTKESATQNLITALQTAISDEITRLEALITSLGGDSPADIDAVTAKVQTSVDNLSAVNDALTTAATTLNAERPTPPSP